MMDPLASYIYKQHILRLLSQQAIMGNSSTAPPAKVSHSCIINIPLCVGGSGVYFNDREVPPEMHVPLSSRGAPVVQRLPSGKPMPQPPRLMMTKVSGSVIKPYDTELEFSQNKRKPESQDDSEGNRTKRARTSTCKVPLTSEQEAFIEAALALTNVKNTVDKQSPRTCPMDLSKSPLRGALPPPPFSLSKRVEITSSYTDRVAKSA